MTSAFIPCSAQWQRGDYLLSTERNLLDVDWIHYQLSVESYWAKGQSREMTLRSLQGSLPFGLYYQQQQIGIGRVITDYTRFAYLCDLIISNAHRGKGLGRWFVECITQHPELTTVRRWLLTTDNAHEVYRRAGWRTVEQSERMMELRRQPETRG